MAAGGAEEKSATSADAFFALNAKFVGGLQFWSVAGHPPFPGMNIEPLGRRNVDGVAFRQIGRSAAPFPLIVRTDIANTIDLENMQLALMALKGTVIRFRNDRIMAYKNYVCLDVIIPQIWEGLPNPRRITSSVGGLTGNGIPAFWLTAFLTLQYSFGV